MGCPSLPSLPPGLWHAVQMTPEHSWFVYDAVSPVIYCVLFPVMLRIQWSSYPHQFGTRHHPAPESVGGLSESNSSASAYGPRLLPWRRTPCWLPFWNSAATFGCIFLRLDMLVCEPEPTAHSWCGRDWRTMRSVLSGSRCIKESLPPSAT